MSLPFKKLLATVLQDGPMHTATEGSGLTALAGGGQTGATPLVYGFNEVSTVASANDSVILPPAVAGNAVYVANTGANSMQVFGDAGAGDTINAVATGTGVAVANTKNAIFFAIQTANKSASIPGRWRMVLTA